MQSSTPLADLEKNGDMGFLAKQPSWFHAFLQRFARMMQRDKNHACVIVWSLGNESGYGTAHDMMKAWGACDDQSRPIQYEACHTATATDIICPMYPSPQNYKRLTGDHRPLIPCEIMHAMGNSTGNAQEWWDLIRSSRNGQGCFIWDWVDQGLHKTDEVSGVDYWGYGGDFGLGNGEQAFHDAQFCINGLCFPDRTPKPGLFEVKHVTRPLVTSLSQWTCSVDGTCAAATLVVLNRYDFMSLEHLRLAVSLEVAGIQVASLPPTRFNALALLRPGQSVEIRIELELTPLHKHALEEPQQNPLLPCEAFLLVHASLSEATAWATAGHIVATEQLAVAPPPRPPSLPLLPTLGASQPTTPVASVRPSPPLRAKQASLAPELVDDQDAVACDKAEGLYCTETAAGFLIEGRAVGGLGRVAAPFSLFVCKRSGKLSSLRVGGNEMVSSGPDLCLWRAPTDNDNGGLWTMCSCPRDTALHKYNRFFRVVFTACFGLRKRTLARWLDLLVVCCPHSIPLAAICQPPILGCLLRHCPAS